MNESSPFDSYDRVSWADIDRKGFCNAYCTSIDGHQIVALTTCVSPNSPASELIIHNAALNVVERIYKLPFAVLTISALPITCKQANLGERMHTSIYLVSEASTAAYYLIDIRDGSYTELVYTKDRASTSAVRFAEKVDASGTSHNITTADKIGDLEARKLLRSDACLVLHRSLERSGQSHSDETTIYLIDRPSQSVLSIDAKWISRTDNMETSVWEELTWTVTNTAPLTLSSRAIGMGYCSASGELAVIGENKHVYLYSTRENSLTACNTDAPTVMSSLPRLLDYHNTVVFLIHKPLGVLSSAKDYETAPRGTVYDVAGRAGFPVNIGLVGRLDGDTSGIMVFTNDGRLNARILHPIIGAESTEEEERLREDETTSNIGQSLRVVHLDECPSQDAVPSPLAPAPASPYCAPDEKCTTFQQLKHKEYILTLLQGKNNYCIEDGVFNTAKFEEEFGQPLVFNRYNTEFNVKEASIKVLKRYQDPQYNTSNRANLGWVLQVLVNINEGKHKQIRRLAKRAGYITVGLERTSMCGGMLTLASVPIVGQCRWLSTEEKLSLYKGFQLI